MSQKNSTLSISVNDSNGLEAENNHILLQSSDYPIAYGIFVANRIPKKYMVSQSSEYSLDSSCKAIVEALKSYSTGKLPKQYSYYILNLFSQFNYLSLLHYFTACGADSNYPRPEMLPQPSKSLPKNAAYLTKFLELLRAIKQWYCQDDEGKAEWHRDISLYTSRELKAFEASAVVQDLKEYIKVNASGTSLSSSLKSSLLSKALLKYPALLGGEDDRRLRLAQYTLDKLTSERFAADPRQLHKYLATLDSDLKAYVASTALAAEERRARNDIVKSLAEAVENFSKNESTITVAGAAAYGLDSKDTDVDVIIVNKGDVNKEDDAANRARVLHSVEKWKPHFANIVAKSSNETETGVTLACAHSRSKMTVNVNIGLGSRSQLANSRLMQSFASQCVFFLPLVRVVKQWAKSRQVIDGTGFANGWTLTLMVAQFLQLYGLLTSMHPSSPLCPAHDQHVKDLDSLAKPAAPVAKGAWAKSLITTTPTIVNPAAITSRIPLSAKRSNLPAFIYNNTEYKSTIDRLFASSATAAAKNRRRSSITPGDISTGATERIEKPLLDAEEWKETLDSEKGKLYVADHIRIGLNDNESFDSLPAKYKYDVHRLPANKAVATPSLSLSTLFAGFFTFYAHLFDRSLCGISVRRGHLVWAEQYRQPRVMGGFNDEESRVFCVEEPFDAHSNTARKMTSPRVTAFFLELRRAALLLREQQSYDDVCASLVRTYRDLQLCVDQDASTLGVSNYEYSRLLSCLLDKTELAALQNKAKAAAVTSVGGSKASTLTAEQRQQLALQAREARKARMDAKLARKKAIREKREQKKAMLLAAARERQERYDALMNAVAMAQEEREKQLEALREEQEQDELFKITYDAEEEEEEEEDYLDHFSFDPEVAETNYVSGITLHSPDDDDLDKIDEEDDENPIIHLASLPSPKSSLNFRNKRQSLAPVVTSSILHILQDEAEVSDDEDDQAMHFSFV